MQFTGTKILVVDDSRHARAIVVTLLQTTGAEIRECSDGKAALAELRNWPAEIVIVDYEMRPMNGADFTSAVRQIEKGAYRRTGILMMTAHTDQQHVYSARASGVDGLVAKPLSAASLFTKIDHVLRRSAELSI